MNIYHDEGVIFRKVQAESGISYLAVEDKTASSQDRTLLVRHGDPSKGNCGYYPLGLLYADREKQVSEAKKKGRNPPSLFWVKSAQKYIQEMGVEIIH